jgi:hypothetical protein
METTESSVEHHEPIEEDSVLDEPLTCVICHESMEPHHQIVRPRDCSHTFHAICITIWLARHRNCPLCRRKISLSTQMPWRTLFSTALVISHEMAVERATYAYTFLSLMLRRFKTADTWNTDRDGIIMAAEHFEVGTTRLPFLDLTSRTCALKEKKKWYKLYIQLTNESIKNSPRIQSARRYILETLIFIFQE